MTRLAEQMARSIAGALERQRILNDIEAAERKQEIAPAFATLLRRMMMSPSEVGSRPIRRERNNAPHQGARERARRLRRMTREETQKAPAESA